MSWVEDAAGYIDRARERERSLPILGSEERPYELIVPPWVEALAKERGEDLQEVADRIFRPHVKVTVYRPLP